MNTLLALLTNPITWLTCFFVACIVVPPVLLLRSNRPARTRTVRQKPRQPAHYARARVQPARRQPLRLDTMGSTVIENLITGGHKEALLDCVLANYDTGLLRQLDTAAYDELRGNGLLPLTETTKRDLYTLTRA